MNPRDRSLAAPSYGDRYLPTTVPAQLPYDFMDLLQKQEDDESGINFRAIWGAAYRNRYLTLSILALSLLGGVAITMLTPRSYQARAIIEIDQQPAKVLETEDRAPVLAGAEMDRYLETQVNVLNSRSMATRVIEDLKLYNDAFLKASGQKGTIPGETPVGRRNRVIRTLQDDLDIELKNGSRIVNIKVDSRDPRMAASIANSYSQNFISSSLQRRFDTSAYSRNFLKTQLDITKGRLEQSERALIRYARNARLLDASTGASSPGQGSAPRSLTTANLVSLNADYAQARAERVQLEQRWRQAQATPLMSLPEVLSNPAIGVLSQKAAELEAAHNENLQRRKQDHPSVKQEEARLEELNRQIAALAARIRDSIEDRYLVGRAREAGLSGYVSQLKGEALSEQDRGVGYNILKREVETNNELYNGLLQRYKELSAAAGVTTNNISIVDRAEPPSSPYYPRPMVNMMIAGIIGLALALMAVFVREMFDDSVREPGDVDYKLGMPLLGSIPRIRRGSSPFAELLNPRSAVAEAYHTVRAGVELSLPEMGPKAILVTSSRESEGKTSTALALAMELALSGKRVLLVDADLRDPTLHTLLELDNKAGLSNLLVQQVSVAQVVQPTQFPGLQFLAAGPLPPNPALLLATVHFGKLLNTLREHYDAIIIDGAPVLGLADAPQISAVADGTVFVIEANRSHWGRAKIALHRLVRSRAVIVGVVMTKLDPRKAADGYGYHNYAYGAGRASLEASANAMAA